MKSFWKGFEKRNAPIEFKHHTIVVFWAPGDGEDVKSKAKTMSFKYPTVKLKTVNVRKDPRQVERYKITKFPTVLLLKDGREIDRDSVFSPTLLENMFRKAHV